MRNPALRTPRVLVVAHRLGIGGTEWHLARVLPALKARGLDVSLFTIASGGALEDEFERRSITVSGPEVHDAPLLQRYKALQSLRSALQRARPDILHMFLTEPYFTGSLAAAGAPGLLRIMSRRSLRGYQQRHRLAATLERRLHRSTDVLLGNSLAVVDELTQECGDSRKVGLIHNGVDLAAGRTPDERRAARTALGMPDDALVLAAVGNLYRYKGHGDLLAAMGLVHSRLSKPWRLVILGRDQGEGSSLRRQAEALGIADNLAMPGETRDPGSLLDAADIGVLPSHQEGFSNSLIEKMAKALPVVATRVGGNLDAIVDGESGRLVPPRDPVALGAAILALAEDPTLRWRFGQAARRRVEERFSLDRCVDRYLGLYTGLLDTRGATAQQMIDG